MNIGRFESKITDSKIFNMVKALVKGSKDNMPIDNFCAHEMTFHMRDCYGLVIDWHVTSSALDQLSRGGHVTRTHNHNGMTYYKF